MPKCDKCGKEQSKEYFQAEDELKAISELKILSELRFMWVCKNETCNEKQSAVILPSVFL